jgi:hypothetical protein
LGDEQRQVLTIGCGLNKVTASDYAAAIQARLNDDQDLTSVVEKQIQKSSLRFWKIAKNGLKRGSFIRRTISVSRRDVKNTWQVLLPQR